MVLRGSSIAGFTLGDQISLRELIWGLMLPSGNDAAYTIAVHLGRQQAGNPDLGAASALEVFAWMMNDYAKDLGAYNTHFTVPDGFHHPNHYTTAYDLAIMAQAAMQDPFLREVVGTSRYEAVTWVGPNVRPWGNSNQLVRSSTQNYYQHATGLKTGYTGEAGFTMVSSASHNGLDLIAVVLNINRDGRWNDSIRLLNYGLENFTWHQLLEENEVIQVVSISKQDRKQPDTMAIVAVQGFGEIFELDAAPRIKRTIIIDEQFLDTKSRDSGAKASSDPSQPTIMAPVLRGQVVGQLVLTLDGEEIFRTDLAATEEISAMPWWRQLLLPTGLAVGLGLPGMLLIKRKGKRRKHRYVIAVNRFG
jgi:D-alanyl-D-alanine carboxypeptidase (penicillin-binding protein 5/6)